MVHPSAAKGRPRLVNPCHEHPGRRSRATTCRSSCRKLICIHASSRVPATNSSTLCGVQASCSQPDETPSISSLRPASVRTASKGIAHADRIAVRAIAGCRRHRPGISGTRGICRNRHSGRTAGSRYLGLRAAGAGRIPVHRAHPIDRVSTALRLASATRSTRTGVDRSSRWSRTPRPAVTTC